jgi:hypothetical protein
MGEVLVDLGMFALFAIFSVSALLYLAGPKDQPPFGQDDEALAALVSRRDMSEDEAARLAAIQRQWAHSGCPCGCGDAA